MKPQSFITSQYYKYLFMKSQQNNSSWIQRYKTYQPPQCTEQQIRKKRIYYSGKLNERTYVDPYRFFFLKDNQIKLWNQSRHKEQSQINVEIFINQLETSLSPSRLNPENGSPQSKLFASKTKQSQSKVVDKKIDQKENTDTPANQNQPKICDKQVNTDPLIIQSKAYNRNPRIGSFFQGYVLEDEQDSRQFLTQVVEKAKGETIRLTRLLFRFDSNNKTNIHTYVDDRKDVMFLGRTINDFLIAAYSEVAFSQKMPVGGCAFLASLTNRRVYPLASSTKALTYDPFFLIFGNSQVRVSADRPEVYSNFGVTSGVYTARGDKVDCLLGQGQAKEIALKYYEVHQIIYK